MARFRWTRPLAVVAALGLLITACSGDGNGNGEGKDDSENGNGSDAVSTEQFPYYTATFSDLSQGNTWGWLHNTTVWNSYVMSNTRSCRLYSAPEPSFEWVPDMAAEQWEPAQAEGDAWVVELQLADGVQWSDGEPITANDFAFTYEVVKELNLGANWVANWIPIEEGDEGQGLLSVEAVDDSTIKFTFNEEPGIQVWPNSVGTIATIQPEHFWAPKLEEARGAEAGAEDEEEAAEGEEDAQVVATRNALLSMPNDGEPSCGATVWDEWVEGAHATTVPNTNWYNNGLHITQYENGAIHIENPNLDRDEVYLADEPGGDVVQETVSGPYFTDVTFTLYGDQNAAVLGLESGEADLLLNSLGMLQALQHRVLADDELQVTSNESHGYRYVGFNMHEDDDGEWMSPMGDPAMRNALAYMINKELMAEDILGGAASPMYALLPKGNVKWHNEEVAAEFASVYEDLDTAERLELAVQELSDAGYTWDSEPEAIFDANDEFQEVQPGSHIIMPDGEPMRELKMMGPGAGYDPMRAVYLQYIEQWLTDLGVPVDARETSFNAVSDGINDPSNFDLFILGFSLGSPAAPGFYESFFTSDGGWNRMAYNNPEFDAAVNAYQNAGTKEEAYEIMWEQLEPTIFEDKPHWLLFNASLIESHRAVSVAYPFLDTLDGLQGTGAGMQSWVVASE